MPRKQVTARTCIGCGRKGPKKEFLRIVRANEDQVIADLTGKRPGRGAYLCLQPLCWETGLKRGRLEHALRGGVSAEERQTLLSHLRQAAEVLKVSHGQ